MSLTCLARSFSHISRLKDLRRRTFINGSSLLLLLLLWVRAKVSIAILRRALLCLRGSRIPRRRNLDVKDRDLEIENSQAGLP